MLSPGTYGHGGAWGTQAWIDPVKRVAYVLMVQRSNFPNSDASDVRREFQQAAAHGAPGVALLYLGATVVGALLAVWAGTTLTSLAAGPR